MSIEQQNKAHEKLAEWLENRYELTRVRKLPADHPLVKNADRQIEHWAREIRRLSGE